MELIIRDVEEPDAASVAELLNHIIRQEIYTVMDPEVSLDEQIDLIRTFPKEGFSTPQFSPHVENWWESRMLCRQW